MVDVVPHDITEERLAHDFLCISWSVAESLIGLTGEQLLQDGNRVPGHVNGVERLVCQNGIIDLILILTSERRLLEKHLVYQNTKCPPIDRSTILFVQQDLSSSLLAIVHHQR